MSKKQQPKLKIIKKDNKFQLLTEDNQVLNKPGVKTTDLGFPNLDPMTITDFNNYNTPGRYAINLDGFNSIPNRPPTAWGQTSGTMSPSGSAIFDIMPTSQGIRQTIIYVSVNIMYSRDNISSYWSAWNKSHYSGYRPIDIVAWQEWPLGKIDLNNNFSGATGGPAVYFRSTTTGLLNMPPISDFPFTLMWAQRLSTAYEIVHSYYDDSLYVREQDLGSSATWSAWKKINGGSIDWSKITNKPTIQPQAPAGANKKYLATENGGWEEFNGGSGSSGNYGITNGTLTDFDAAPTPSGMQFYPAGSIPLNGPIPLGQAHNLVFWSYKTINDICVQLLLSTNSLFVYSRASYDGGITWSQYSWQVSNMMPPAANIEQWCDMVIRYQPNTSAYPKSSADAISVSSTAFVAAGDAVAPAMVTNAASAGYLLMSVFKDNNNAAQIAISSTDGTMATRGMDNGTWSQWEALGGNSDDSLVYEGKWSASTTYKKGDIVYCTFIGNKTRLFFISRVDNNLNNQPPLNLVGDTDNAFNNWMRINDPGIYIGASVGITNGDKIHLAVVSSGSGGDNDACMLATTRNWSDPSKDVYIHYTTRELYDSRGKLAAMSDLQSNAGTNLFDKIIRTQAEFDALVNPNNPAYTSNWGGIKSVAFIGGNTGNPNGDFTLSYANNFGVKVPYNVKQIQGFNNAKITVTNFQHDYDTAQGGLWYYYMPPGDDYSVKDLTLECTSSGHSHGFVYCMQLTNCRSITTSTGSYKSSSAFYGCKKLINCVGKSMGECSSTFAHCKELINCTGIGIGGSFIGSDGTGFVLCSQLTNCNGSGTSSNSNSSGYGFWGCSYCNNCKAGDTPSKTALWGGTNTFRDDDSCQLI